MPFPFRLWHLLARLASVLPKAPLTDDQVFLMQEDNVVSPEYPGFPELGYRPVGITAALGAVLEGRGSDFNREPHSHGK